MIKTQQGSFGYRIGRRIYLMNVEKDADLLWPVLVREIYVLINHYGSIEQLQKEFEKLNIIYPKQKKYQRVNINDVKKCEAFTNLQLIENKDSQIAWSQITKYCQHSYINILESGYLLNNGEDLGIVFILDFTNKNVEYYWRDLEKKKHIYEKVQITEIMTFEDMPTKSLHEIMSNMMTRFNEYKKKIIKANEDIEKANNMIKKANEIYGDKILLNRANILLYEIECKKAKIEMEYRYFYHRLDDLDMIDHMS